MWKIDDKKLSVKKLERINGIGKFLRFVDAKYCIAD